MAFPDSFLNELTERNDIADVVSGYVRLDKKSGSNMFGLCPFHSEKTPSFSVSPDKQIYHCFGCGKGGGVINFIMEVENLSFPEAVEFLAKRAGMQLPEETESKESKHRARLLALNKDAARFFYEQLQKPWGEPAREYMRKRRIGTKTATDFGLGFAPDTWDSLRNAMKEKGYTDFEMFDAGLLRKGKNNGFYDCFRNRLMFPVIDVRGNVIGFSGRILGDGEPKYMNSPETPVFNKGRNLFALNLAKKSKSGYIILSEGNIDVASLHQAGFDSAVASLGTSLTPEQARLISRYTNQVIIAYDNDQAGAKASKRAIEILEKLDLKVKVLRLEGAKDPDEFIKLKGADAFRNLLEASENQVDYRLRDVTEKYDLTADDQKVAFLKEASELIARLPNIVERQVYAMRIAQMSGTKDDAIIAEVERLHKKKVYSAHRETQRQETSPEKQLQPGDRSLRYDNPASAAAEEGIVRLLALEPRLAKRDDLPPKEHFSSPALGKIYALVLERLAAHRAADPTTMADALSKEEMALFVSLSQKPENLSGADKTMSDYIRRLEQEHERTGSGQKPDINTFNAIINQKKNKTDGSRG